MITLTLEPQAPIAISSRNASSSARSDATRRDDCVEVEAPPTAVVEVVVASFSLRSTARAARTHGNLVKIHSKSSKTRSLPPPHRRVERRANATLAQLLPVQKRLGAGWKVGRNCVIPDHFAHLREQVAREREVAPSERDSEQLCARRLCQFKIVG